MDNTDKLPIKSTKLNNFEHREDSAPSIQEPQDLVTGATPAQKERLVYLVDDAIDVVENALHTGSEKVRLAAAQDVMDRAGLPKNTKTTTDLSPVSAVPAEVFTEFVAGLAKMFNVPAAAAPKDVTPKKKSKKASSKIAAPQPAEEEPETLGGLPLSVLTQYQED